MFTVLLPVDKGEDATRTTDFISELPHSPNNVRVVVLNVVEEFEIADNGAPISSKDLYDESMIPNSVSAAVERLDSNGIETSVRREHGNPNEEIAEVAEEIDANVIVMGGRKQTPIGKVIFGSVAQSVLLSVDVPVTLIMSD